MKKQLTSRQANLQGEINERRLFITSCSHVFKMKHELVGTFTSGSVEQTSLVFFHLPPLHHIFDLWMVIKQRISTFKVNKNRPFHPDFDEKQRGNLAKWQMKI